VGCLISAREGCGSNGTPSMPERRYYMTSPAFSLPKKGTERQITSWSQLHKFRPLRQNGDEWSVSAFSGAALRCRQRGRMSTTLAPLPNLPRGYIRARSRRTRLSGSERQTPQGCRCPDALRSRCRRLYQEPGERLGDWPKGYSDGVVLLVAPNERQVRIAATGGHNSLLTHDADAWTAYVCRNSGRNSAIPTHRVCECRRIEISSDRAHTSV